MGSNPARYLLLLFLILPINGTDFNENGTPETRDPRASRRAVKLYSGTRPKPIVCVGEGFQADPTDCTIFHRCIKNGNGRYLSFRFQCGPGTIYDPESEVCNHPERTKRMDCGVNKPIHVPNIEFSFDNDISKEVPLPISTKDPLGSQKTTQLGLTTKQTTSRVDVATSAIKYPWTSTKHQYSEFTPSTSVPWAFSSKRQEATSVSVPSTKRDVMESSSMSTTFSSISSQKIRSTTPRIIIRQTTSQSGDICTSDGFMGDSENCRKFYRCVSNQRGGFIRYEFLCSESTIWDDETHACNYAWSVKRRRCGRGSDIDRNKGTSTITEKKKPSLDTVSPIAAPNSTQTQLQINYGSKVTQTQTQISNGSVIQNQTQINYGPDVSNNTTKPSILQNQTQLSHGAAVSQTQTQINYGDKSVQTQLQIDHSKDSSQSQTQLSESTSTTRTTQNHDAQATPSPTTNNVCTESGFMGDSEDCKKFYRCVDNGRGGFIRYEFSCGEGTVWDASTEACNHAWAVKECGGKAPTETSSQNTITTTKSSSKPAESSTTSTTTSTQSYYSSTEDIDEEDNDIPYGNQPSSSAPSVPPQHETTVTKAPQITNDNNCKSSGFMGDNSDCKKFYRCVDNGNGGYTRYEFSCGEGTVWDQKIQACNHAWAVENCGGVVSTSTTASSVHTTSTQVTSQIPPQNDDYDTGYGSHHDEPQSSTNIFTTTTTTTTVKSSLTATSQSSHSTISTTGNDCTSSGFMGDNNDCKKFYRCVDNGNGGYTRYEFSCGEGTVWDSKIEACNHAWAVEKCGGNLPEDINKVETTTQKHESTSHVASSTTQISEPDDDNDVGYGQQSNEPQKTTSTSTPPQYQDNDNIECKSSGYMGDKNDCKKFYRCVDNGDGTFTRYEFSCGEGTVWDPKIETCNHAWAVENCGGTSNLQTTSKPIQPSNDNVENIGGYPAQNEEYTTQNTSSTTESSYSTTSTTVPNAYNSCKTSGFMGDSTDCKRFYRCVDNGQGGFTRYEFSCGEGTVWDQSIEACNHAWAVKGECSQSGQSETSPVQSSTQQSSTDHEIDSGDQEYNQQTTQKTSTSPTLKPSGSQCTQEGFYGDENNCKNFYRCVDNGQGGFIKYEFTCGEGTIWSQDIQACDHESSDKKCNTHSSQPTSTKPYTENDEMLTESTTKYPGSTSTESENNFTSQKPQPPNNKCQNEGFYGDSNDCKKFYRCVDNGNGGYTKYDFTCGDGTVWDEEILACNHETTNKKCTIKSGSSSHTTSSTTTSAADLTESSTNSQEQQTTRPPGVTDSNDKNDQCESEGFYANSNDCKKFYRCVDNGKGGFTKYDFSCGEGTVWVQEIQACDYDNDITSCSNKNNSTKPQTTEQQSTTSESTTTTANPSSTQSQVPDKEDDEYPSSSSSKPPAVNEKCESEGFYGNKNDCKQFYRCVDNGQGSYTKYEFTCGEGTAWDSNIQTCNHINEVESCQNTNEKEDQSKPSNDEESSESTSTNKDSTSTTESTKPSSTDKCHQEGYFGNTKDCTKFYRCVDNGKGGLTKYDFTCGEGTIWDQDLTTCNHPQDVANPSCNNTESSQSPSDTSSSTDSSETTPSSSTTTQSSQNSQSTTESSNQSSSNCSQESSTKKPANQKVKCEKAGYYPDPDDCKKFYRCVDWDGDGQRFSVYHFDCGEGTIWDPQLETCNHEDSVYPPRDCSGTQSQNVSQETTTTTQESTTSQDNSTTESTTTQSSTEETTTSQQSSSSEQTTQQSSTTDKTTTTTQTSSEQTTSQSSTEQSTTQQTTTSEKTTQQSTSQQTTTEQTSTSQEQTTAQQSTTSEKTTTQQSTTSEQTTEQSSSNEQTTQQTSSGEQTTQQTSSSEQTTQQTTSSEQTTQQTSSEQTTQETSSSEQTTQQTSSSEQTTQQTSSSEQTTQQTSSSEQTTQQTSSSEQTTQQTSSSEQTTQQTSPSEQTTQQTSSSEQTTQQTSSSEQTTQQTSSTDDTTTESSTTEQQSSTTEQSTATTEQSNSTEQTSEENTTQGSSTTETSTTTTTESSEGTTTESEEGTTSQETSSSEKECPETDDDQYLYVCPTSFRRHPKYCNMFYQCTEDNNSHEIKIATFKCPNNTIYDESKTQCVEEDKADKKCNGQIAQKRRVKRRNADYKEPIEVSDNRHSCSAVGYYPFEKDECSGAFLKCQKTKSGKLRGLVHRCPEGYMYWSISKRCEKEKYMKGCKKSANIWKDRWEIPMEKKNIAK